MSRRRAVAIAGVTVVVLGTGLGVALARNPDAASVGQTAPQEQVKGNAAMRSPVAAADVAAAKAAGNRFLDEYVDGDGRVVRRDQGGDTVSEGQAYGMLIAAAIDDRPRFDAIWQWTQDNIERPDKLLSVSWAEGKVSDPLPATDADLDAARALLLASERWDVPAYRTAALEIGNSILLRETIDVAKRKVLVAGPWARTSPAVVNPSYFSPRAYDALFEATGDRRWQELQDTSLEIIDGLTTNSPSLPPDWARVHGTQVVPSYQPGDPSKGVRFAYEATRVLPRYAEMCPVYGSDPAAATPAIGRRLVARAWPFMKAQGPDGPTADYRADGRPLGGNRNAVATIAAASAADATGEFAERNRLFGVADQVQAQTPTYYGGAWIALGRIMLSTDLLGSCGRSTTEIS
ncbi:MAG: hypothetical protein JHD16_02600 [Solirubrobacteraceae bacterium]|nr:hypothetical protein [Solirubrobacteraceae bacterium]